MPIDFNNAPPQREPKEDSNQAPQDPIQAFAEKLAEHGLDPGGIIADGELHRLGKKKACWYVFFQGDICGAAFGDWQKGIKGTWCSVSEGTLTYKQREKYRKDMEAAKAIRKAQEKKNHAQAKIIAKKEWGAAMPVIGMAHSYLEKKGVNSHHLRVDKKDRLLIPSIDGNKEIHSLQYIKPNGDKKYQPLGARKGFFFEFEGAQGNNKLYICEGYSTGASIHEATGATVICAFDSGNLPRVAKVIREIFPSHYITIAADDDRHVPGNPGVTKAKEAALDIGVPFVWPVFQNVDPGDKPPTDFNDLFAMEGPTAVVAQLVKTGVEAERQIIPPFMENSTALTSWLIKKPAPRKYILTLNGVGFMPKGVVGVLAATGGTGKTFFLMSLAQAFATGGSFGPIKAPKPLKTLCIFGEDDQDELGRRFWDICKGKPSKNLYAASVYGEVGPLMKMDGKNPVRADGFYWLDETIKGHPGVDVVILDPKSRFYGLEENNNDHGTQWVGCLETLRKRYNTNILFAAHTAEDKAGKLSQAMNRGASSVVDGCRWQAGMIPMDKNTADYYRITDPHNFVIFDAPKNNYSPRGSHPLYFKRGEGGVLEYTTLQNTELSEMANTLHGLLKDDKGLYTLYALGEGSQTKEIANTMKENHSSFERTKSYKDITDFMVKKGVAKWIKTGTGNSNKTVLDIIKK
ncbi:MAG: AAA family ATPase [Desulfobacula sp.]|nr:AAA family ATPase [Desulfobacula sp.]